MPDMEAHCPRLRTQASCGPGHPDLASLLPRLLRAPVKREWVGVGLLWEIEWLQAEIPPPSTLQHEKALRSPGPRAAEERAQGLFPLYSQPSRFGRGT